MSDKPPISALLRGGLGNQLFIAVTASRLSIGQNTSLRLLHSSLPHGGLKISKLLPARSDRHYEEISARDRIRFALASRHLVQRPLNVVSDRELRLLSADQTLGKYLFGYFQSGHEYPVQLDQVELEILSGLKTWRDEVSQSTPVDSDDIVIHVRMGDYQSRRSRNFHGQLDRSYYIRAVEFLRSHGACGRVLVVSDDPDSACELLTEVKPFLGSMKNPGNVFEDLARLTLSNFLIISNSSFSWWGARLSQGARVVAPDRWYRDPRGPQGPQLSAWHTIEARFA